MTKIWAFIRHNSGIVIGLMLCALILVWCYGCPSTVTSISNPPGRVTRPELELEVEHWLALAEIRFRELDQQDEFKRTLFAMATKFMSTGEINPAAIALTLGNLLGIGAVIDNVRKRTYINTRKSQDAKEKEKVTT